MARPSTEQWSAALHQLREAHKAGQRSTAMVRMVASGLGVTERAVWLRLAANDSGSVPPSTRFRLSDTGRAAYLDLRGKVAAVHRMRSAVLAGRVSREVSAPLGQDTPPQDTAFRKPAHITVIMMY